MDTTTTLCSSDFAADSNTGANAQPQRQRLRPDAPTFVPFHEPRPSMIVKEDDKKDGRENNGTGNNGSNKGQTTTAGGCIRCANCGCYGHVHRICNHPISSFGIICYRVRPTDQVIEYLLVQRKDSLCYVEFIRGKYMLQNRNYIVKLLSNMTPDERHRLLTRDFDSLWYEFWQTDQTKTFMKEYDQSKMRFNLLRNGYLLRQTTSTAPTDDVVFFDLASAVSSATTKYSDTEWGFPKGRRNINESDLRCACREFREETGIDACHIHVMGSVKPFEEVFSGSNKVRYRHVYYIAYLKQHNPHQPIIPDDEEVPRSVQDSSGCHLDPFSFSSQQLSTASQKEISRIGWFCFKDVMDRIRDENVERREMFKRVNAWVLQNEHSRQRG